MRFCNLKSLLPHLNRICFYGSGAVILLVIVCGILHRGYDFTGPPWFQKWLLPVTTAAAVGYLTNFIAIWLLFRPYKPQKYFFNLQGVIPKQQQELAEKLSEEIPANLLPPERLSEKMEKLISDTLYDQALFDSLKTRILLHAKYRKEKIYDSMSSCIESAFRAGVDAIFTPENIRYFYGAYGGNFLRRQIENGTPDSMILGELKKKTPDITAMIREFISAGIGDYMREQHPVFCTLAKADVLAKQIAENLNWELIESKISDCFDDPRARAAVKQELYALEEKVEQMIGSPALETGLAKLKAEHSDAIFETLQLRMRELLPGMVEQMLQREETWQILKTELIPVIESFLQNQLRRSKNKIIEGLDLPGSIREAVMSRQPAEIHELVNRVSEEHLILLQLWGFLLGGIAGFLLVLAQ